MSKQYLINAKDEIKPLDEDIQKAYQKGRNDRENEIIECIQHYENALAQAMQDTTPIGSALMSMRMDEVRVRQLIIEQIKGWKNERSTVD